MGATLLIAAIVAASPTHPSTAFAAAWDEPTTIVSSELFVPDDAWPSADGRMVVLSNSYDYHLRVIDRATGQKTRPILPALNAAVMVPDGSAMILRTDVNLAGANAFGQFHLYRYALPNGPAERLTDGIDPSMSVFASDTSADGRYVAVTLIPTADTFPNLRERVAILDAADGSIETVDDAIPGVDRQSRMPTISADGRYVAFQSSLGNCYPSCSYRSFVVDRSDDSFRQIDVDATSGEPDGNSFYPEIAADGQHVIFYSNATDLVAGTSTSIYRLYARDLQSGTTEFVSVSSPVSWTAGISGNGRYVTYLDDALTDADTPYQGPQVFVLDRSTSQRHQISVPPGGGAPNGIAKWTDITDDGRTVFFQSDAGNLAPGARTRDVFARGPQLVPPPPPPPTTFQSLAPRRFLDTRIDGQTIDDQSRGVGLRLPGDVLQLQVAGRGNVPVDADAIVMNVTVTEPVGPGFVTAWPCTSPATAPPLASSLNFVTGETIPNLVIVPIGANGRVCLQTSVSAAHLIADVSGYFPAGAAYDSLSPQRVLDTRADGQTIDGQFQAIGSRPAGEALQLSVLGRAGVPPDATAVVMNLTVTEPSGPGFVTAWPCTVPMIPPPLASNLNFVGGQTIANLVVVPIGPAGTVCLQSSVSASHLVADVSGYFPAGASYSSLSPRRLLDSRAAGRTADGQFADFGLRQAGQILQLQVGGRGNVAANARAVVLNVTVTESSGPGFVTAWPCDEAPTSPPLASNLNFTTRQTIANLVVVPLGPTGKVCLQSSVSSAHLIADVYGFFPVDG